MLPIVRLPIGSILKIRKEKQIPPLLVPCSPDTPFRGGKVGGDRKDYGGLWGLSIKDRIRFFGLETGLCAFTSWHCSLTKRLCSLTKRLCSITLRLCSLTKWYCSLTKWLCGITKWFCSITKRFCSITKRLCSLPKWLCRLAKWLCGLPSIIV